MTEFTPPEQTIEPVAQPLPASGVDKPRRRVQDCLDGSRLGNRVQLAEALLKAGRTITATAKDLKISRHSAQAIAARMRTEAIKGVAAPSGEQHVPPNVQKEFDTYVRGDLQRIAKLALGNITPEKAQKATVRDLSFAADKTLARLEAIEGRTSNFDALAQIVDHFGITPSHSASRVTLEQKITVETQHLPPAAK